MAPRAGFHPEFRVVSIRLHQRPYHELWVDPLYLIRSHSLPSHSLGPWSRVYHMYDYDQRPRISGAVIVLKLLCCMINRLVGAQARSYSDNGML